MLKRTIHLWPNLTLKAGVLALGVFVLMGCSVVLPSESSTQRHPWTTFEEVKTAYNNVEIEKTDEIGLKEQGFDPDKTANMQILSYLDVINRFATSSRDDLPDGIKRCIEVRESCKAYMASPSNIKRNRVGNVAMDLLGFRQETRVTGWKFEAVFVMVDNLVTYKLWSGTPDIEEYSNRVQPLGPVQSIGGVFKP